MDEEAYDSLAEQLTDPSQPLARPTQAVSGAAAAEAGHAFMLRELGSEEALEIAQRRGRPRIGKHARGASPVVRGRISEEDFKEFKSLEARSGKKQSELVREAVHLLLEQEKRAS